MKKTIFSGIQPSGNLQIGNYLGAIKQWVELQDEYSCILCVVDHHAITVPQDPALLKKRIIEVAKIYLASGIDPKKAVIFQQSDVSAHTELGWILNTVARMSDLYNMTQFKDKAGLDEKKRENVSVGLFDYPVLMAADILLYDTDIVPVGDDQIQHVELTRDIAKRFNHLFGQTFKLPEWKISKGGARIMALDDPTKKMSKSAPSAGSRIELTDDPEQAAKKIMRAVTDTGSGISFDQKEKPGIANLLNIYSLLSGRSIKDLEKEYHNSGYGDFKKGLADVVRAFLADFQAKYNSISDSDVRRILDEGAEQVRPLADKTLQRAKLKLGMR